MAIEPFIDNIYRIQNALSNKREANRQLSSEEDNVSGKSLLDKNMNKNSSHTSLVDTILLDDLIPYLPKQADGSSFKKAIIKIDIEGHEPFVFQNASKLFDLLDVQLIQMEWGHLIENKDHHADVDKMVDFLMRRKFNPYFFDFQLSIDNYEHWPFDVIWIKSNELVIN